MKMNWTYLYTQIGIIKLPNHQILTLFPAQFNSQSTTKSHHCIKETLSRALSKILKYTFG